MNLGSFRFFLYFLSPMQRLRPLGNCSPCMFVEYFILEKSIEPNLQVHYRKVHHYTDETMPPIHREKSIDKYCQESLGYGSDTDSSSSGSCPTTGNLVPTPATSGSGSGSGFELERFPESRMLGLPSTSGLRGGLPGMATFEFPFK